MTQSTKKRIYCFDLIKFISIVCVFFYHIMMDMYVMHPMHNLKFLETIIIRTNIHLAMVACGLFIFISGATLVLNNRDIKPLEFIKNRLIKVLIPFYFAYIIYFIIKVINEKTFLIYGGVPKWRFIFTIMGMDEYISAHGVRTFSLGVGEWFLGCIILCYIAYPFIYKLHKKLNMVFFIFMTLLSIFINYKYYDFGFTIPPHMNFVCQVYNFYLGILFTDLDLIHKIKKWLLLLAILIVAFLYSINIVIFIPENIKNTIFVLSVVIIFAFFENAIASTNTLSKFVVSFNRISLEVFLVHHFIIYQVDYLLSYQRIGGLKTLIVIFIDIWMTLLLAVIVHYLSSYVTKFVKKSHN